MPEARDQIQIILVHTQHQPPAHAPLVGANEDTITVDQSDLSFPRLTFSEAQLAGGESLGQDAGLHMRALLILAQNADIGAIGQPEPVGKKGNVEGVAARLIDALIEIVINDVIADADEAEFEA